MRQNRPPFGSIAALQRAVLYSIVGVNDLGLEIHGDPAGLVCDRDQIRVDVLLADLDALRRVLHAKKRTSANRKKIRPRTGWEYWAEVRPEFARRSSAAAQLALLHWRPMPVRSI